MTEGKNSLVMKNKQNLKNIMVYRCVWMHFLGLCFMKNDMKRELKTDIVLGQVDH